MLLLQVRSTSNNAKGNKRVIYFRYSYDGTDFIIQTWNFIAHSSTNECSKCGYIAFFAMIFHFWFLTLHVSSASDRHWGKKS